jgi:hypothetical protein
MAPSPGIRLAPGKHRYRYWLVDRQTCGNRPRLVLACAVAWGGSIWEKGGIDPVHHQSKECKNGIFLGNRTPRRVTITLSYAAYKGLEMRSAMEGRSMSNLAAFILERALSQES